ncbi:3-keto-5-aminohexanoate cleavage protein [Streptomyces sp. NBC_00091]|uniref:3-keto-5-aminohexanoate cleavage protein n=1 Tax=Streptomyces sp. NBC_00091 TaxID=2975648 RepID=UPI0022558BB7|nr:3-keto-5-aminohexanoate cleavage protein [Streptomyces sp. NBC_00091]MCX5379237.1 3-keto-5-aminohexanoate cleavage protein [Streptomyces sp. NBC_00091]
MSGARGGLRDGLRGALLQVALNGSRGAAEGAAVPLSPGDLARSALEAVAAGAGEVLVHPRTPCGRESLSPRVVGPLLEEMRGAGVRVPLTVPAGVAAEPDPAGRLERVRSWTVLPDRAVVPFAEPGAAELGRALLARGVAVDAVVPLGGGAGPEPLARFLAWAPPERGRVRLVAELAEADPALVAGLRWLPPVPVVLYGREAAAWPVLRLAARCGAGARIGVAQVLRLPDGRPARSNAELVAAAREVREAEGAGPAGGGATATAGSR